MAQSTSCPTTCSQSRAQPAAPSLNKSFSSYTTSSDTSSEFTAYNQVMSSSNLKNLAVVEQEGNKCPIFHFGELTAEISCQFDTACYNFVTNKDIPDDKQTIKVMTALKGCCCGCCHRVSWLGAEITWLQLYIWFACMYIHISLGLLHTHFVFVSLLGDWPSPLYTEMNLRFSLSTSSWSVSKMSSCPLHGKLTSTLNLTR